MAHVLRTMNDARTIAVRLAWLQVVVLIEILSQDGPNPPPRYSHPLKRYNVNYNTTFYKSIQHKYYCEVPTSVL